MGDQQKENQTDSDQLSLKTFLQRQKDCSHDKGFLPNGHDNVPDQVSKQLLVINIVMCSNCGKSFVQMIPTGIGVSAMQPPITMPRMR